MTLLGMLASAVIWAETRYAHAASVAEQFFEQTVKFEQLSNDNRLDRLVRELEAINRRRFNGQMYPGDPELMEELKEEIRFARQYRSDLRERAASAK